MFTNLFYVIFSIIIIVDICESKCYYNGTIENKVNETSRNIILKKHNDLRLKIAKGEVDGQPKGLNLNKLKWDSNLAELAQNIANKCSYETTVINGTNYTTVGQNIALATYHMKDKSGPQWNRIIENLWFKEHEVYKYPDDATNETGHYTQIVWANTTFIGCGYSYYRRNNKQYQMMYICAYGPGGNLNGPPYLTTGENTCPNLC